MPTLYIRDVPEDVAAQLRERAGQRGQSLSSYVAAELTRLAATPSHDDVLNRLKAMDRTDGVTPHEIIEVLHASRP